MASPIIPSISFDHLDPAKYKNIIKNSNEKWAAYFENDKSYKIETYQSILPTSIYGRPESLTKELFVLGVERVDLPKLPNGQHVKWWFIVQKGSCKSCIFLSGISAQDTERKCLNPRVSKNNYEKFSSNEDNCPEWFVGINKDRLEQEKNWGYTGNLFLLAGLVEIGMASRTWGQNIPAIGKCEAYKFTFSLAEAVDIYNSVIFYYLQAYFVKQAGFLIDDSMVILDPIPFLPEIIGDPFINEDELSPDLQKDTNNTLKNQEKE